MGAGEQAVEACRNGDTQAFDRLVERYQRDVYRLCYRYVNNHFAGHSPESARQLQASSGLFFDVFTRYDPENLLISQAHREVLERQLERTRLGLTLVRLASARVVITEPKRTSPFAFPLLIDRTRERVSSESLADRIRRMQAVLERAAG